MIEKLTSADRFVYHYTKSSTAINHILKDRSFRLGRYTNTNDPKETRTWLFKLGTNEHRDLGAYQMLELSDWFSNELKHTARLGCFCMDNAPLSGFHSKDILRRGFAKPRMWAQYANNHTGVCLVFERAKLHQLIDRRFGDQYMVASGAVSYINRDVISRVDDEPEYTINVDHLESVGRADCVRDHLGTYYKELFFEKTMDWRDECEFRWVVFAETADDLYIGLADVLKGIIFGDSTDPADVDEIMKMTTDWNLTYMGLKWRNSSPWYDYANPRYWQRM